MVDVGEDPARAPTSFIGQTVVYFRSSDSGVLRESQSVGPGPTPPNRCFPLSHLFALSPESERLEHASQPEARRAKRNYFRF